jgi:hypothetical protein
MGKVFGLGVQNLKFSVHVLSWLGLCFVCVVALLSLNREWENSIAALLMNREGERVFWIFKRIT